MFRLDFKKNKNKVLIIAEACDNHFGNIDNAKELVLKAKSAGADIIKFQTHIAVCVDNQRTLTHTNQMDYEQNL